MNHIQNSQSLAKLKEALSNLHFKLNNKDIDRLEEEKRPLTYELKHSDMHLSHSEKYTILKLNRIWTI